MTAGEESQGSFTKNLESLAGGALLFFAEAR
jgi:hypothetical protein